MIDASLYMRNTQRHIYYIYYAYIICLCSQSDDDWCKLIYLPFHPGRSQSLEQLNPENRKNSMQCRFFDKILNKLKYFSHLTVPFKSLTMASRLKRESYSSKHKTPRFSLSSCGIIINSQYLADEGSGNWFNPHCLQHDQQHQHQHHDHHQHQDQDLAVEGAEKRFKGILIVSSFPCFFTCVEDDELSTTFYSLNLIQDQQRVMKKLRHGPIMIHDKVKTTSAASKSPRVERESGRPWTKS